ncbi:MAG TPA: XrtA system polysaccharide deacetylase, partial [Fibrobacteria bacterium]|nr:XrtA system polysaccharide deacetylase [Fibrobacteria bacterium]
MRPSWLVASAKRFLDLAAGTTGFTLFIATYPCIALLIKLESPGSALYSQVRVGMNRRSRARSAADGGRGAYAGPERRKADVGGRPFSIFKYRTMRTDAELNGPQLCAKGLDPRVTQVGKWLRALHVDEIPQFINVVRGDMSFIGPRPERPHFTRQYGRTLPHYSDRTHCIRPGLTGLAQILLGYDDSEESVVRKSHYDMSYRASFCSLSTWIKMEYWIIWNTVLYLLKKPQFEGETRDLITLKRAKLLPFLGRALAASSRSTHVTVSFGRSARPLILAGDNSAELAAGLEAMDWEGKPSPEVIIRTKEHLDLEDMGFLVRLAHKVKRHGGRMSLRNAPLKVRKILREIRLDSVLDLQHTSPSVRNFLTVDVECWFHAHHMRSIAPKSTWHAQPTRIVQNMEKLLELMRIHEVKATFFVLGWVADHFPEVVRMIDREGHEIGTHGYHHDLITEMTPEAFEEDLLRSLDAIGRSTSQRVRGHRASNFSVVPSTLWALDILARHGFEYDSSIFPVARKRYGMPDYPGRFPHTVRLGEGRSIRELPMSTLRLGGKLMPVAGGGYLRLYPSQVTERFIERQNLRGLPAMVYLHPWEVDVAQERHYLGPLKTFQHYVNLSSTEWKLNRLMQRFDFGTISETMEMPRLQSLLRRQPVVLADMLPETVAARRAAASAIAASAPAASAATAASAALPVEALPE